MKRKSARRIKKSYKKSLKKNFVGIIFFLVLIVSLISIFLLIRTRVIDVEQQVKSQMPTQPASFQATSAFIYKKNGVEYLHQIAILPDGINAWYQNCWLSDAFSKGCLWYSYSFNVEGFPDGFKVKSLRQFVYYDNGTKLSQFVLGDDGWNGYYRTNTIDTYGNFTYGSWNAWNYGGERLNNGNGTTSPLTRDLIAVSAFIYKKNGVEYLHQIVIRADGRSAYYQNCPRSDAFSKGCLWYSYSFNVEGFPDGFKVKSLRQFVYYDNGTKLSQFVLGDDGWNGYYRTNTIDTYGNFTYGSWNAWNYGGEVFGTPGCTAPDNNEKFGIAGGKDIVTAVDSNMLYGWGNSSSPNSVELAACQSGSMSTFMTLGKLDNPSTVTDATLSDAINKYLSPSEVSDYNALKTFLTNKFPGKTINSALTSYLKIPYYAKEIQKNSNCYPVYQIANEPDYGPYFTPAQYAEYYNYFYKRIKKYHPCSQVMIGGLLGLSTYKDTNNIWHLDWIDNFRKSYKASYGIYPQVDIWNIHPYVDIGDLNGSSITGSNFAVKAENKIKAFKVYLNGISGEGSKPIWITEFAIKEDKGKLVGETCTKTNSSYCPARQNDEWRIVTDYMRDFIIWLKTTGSSQYNVKKWFWYYGGHQPWREVDFVGDFYKFSDGVLNPPGKMYKECNTPQSCPTSVIFPTLTPTPASSSLSASNGNGLTGSYYNNKSLSGSAVITRVDPTINFQWRLGSPGSGVPSDLFSVRWTGYIIPKYTQKYTFYTTTDDGAKLWINNILIVNRWISQPQTEISGSIYLTAGKKYPIKMEYFENYVGATAILKWSSPSTSKQVIPQGQLYSK